VPHEIDTAYVHGAGRGAGGGGGGAGTSPGVVAGALSSPQGGGGGGSGVPGSADKVRELIRKMTEKNSDGPSRSSVTYSAQRQKVY
jgi:hypothetical protein